MNDQHMNYMDYVDDGCMNMFTNDQKTQMRSILNTSRAGLLTSLGCIPVSALDASLSLVAPTDTICGSNQFLPVVRLFNYGSTTLTSTTINYELDSDGVQQYIWTGSLATLESQDVSLPMVQASLGAHTFQAWSSSPNGGPDELTSNDSTNSSFTFMNGNSITLTLDYDTFQLANLVTWEIVIDDGSGTVIASGGGYSQNTTTLKSVCLNPGCYIFNLVDPPDNGEGSFNMVDASGQTLFTENDIFTYSANFCVALPPPSVGEITGNESIISIYPNPTTGLVQIASVLLEDGAEEISVINTIGKVVYRLKNPQVNDQSIDIDLSSLPGGVYYITIRTASVSSTRKICLIR